MNKIIFALAIISMVFTSCKKDPGEEVKPTPTTPVATTGSLNMEFENMFDTLALTLDSQNYVLDNGNKIIFSKFKYYISNIKLIASDGTVYTETESYHLIDDADSTSKLFTLLNVPFKQYASITFMIGVDSARNVSGAQTGALSASNNMFWTWNTGYIMAKVEGASQQSTAPANSVAFHIGGFKGTNSALKVVSPSFNGSTANVSSTVTPEIHLKCNLKEWFMNPTTIDLSTTNNITMVNTVSKSIADNYADMFSIKHIHN